MLAETHNETSLPVPISVATGEAPLREISAATVVDAAAGAAGFAAGFGFWRTGRVGRSGRGAEVPAAATTPNWDAICGTKLATRFTVASRASPGFSGTEVGFT